MPKYRFTVDVLRDVEETIDIIVNAGSLEEAKEMAEKIIVEYPCSGYVADRYLVTHNHISIPYEIGFRELDDKPVNDNADEEPDLIA